LGFVEFVSENWPTREKYLELKNLAGRIVKTADIEKHIYF